MDEAKGPPRPVELRKKKNKCSMHAYCILFLYNINFTVSELMLLDTYFFIFVHSQTIRLIKVFSC